MWGYSEKVRVPTRATDGLPKSITQVVDFVSKVKTTTIPQDSGIGRQQALLSSVRH
jgi:hypothetical protein